MGNPTALQDAYLKERAAGVKARSFDLTSLPCEQTINTGRTIRTMKAWNTDEARHWPALRELLQNTMDYMKLFKNGQLNPAIQIKRGNDKIEFFCGQECVCRISTPSNNELQVEQMYTFPIHPRALDTGVSDTSKGGADTAGGFGDGFKSAAVALLAEDDKCNITWTFDTCSSGITWEFGSCNRPAVGIIAESRILQVQANRTERNHVERDGHPGKKHTMRQIIKTKDIGTAFWREAYPRMQIFWKLDSTNLVATRIGQNFVARAKDHMLHGGGRRGEADAHPLPGIYVKGIWVKDPPIDGTLMCFVDNDMAVFRDRNDVFHGDVVHYVSRVFRECTDTSMLRSLLSPLRGRKFEPVGPPSWLIDEASTHFLNQVVKNERKHIVHEILQIPMGALFAPDDENKSAFFSWASDFLAKRGSPLLTREPDANVFLFPPATRSHVTAKCAELLLSVKRRNIETADTNLMIYAVVEIIMFLDAKSPVEVLAFKDVSWPFVHENMMFVPVTAPTVAFLIKVVNVVDRYIFKETEMEIIPIRNIAKWEIVQK